MTFDDIPLVDLEQEIFCECGSWKNFIDLEDSISLDELMALYEATMERHNRMMRTIAMAMGAEIEEDTSSKSKDKIYQKPWQVDPSRGGEITPAYSENEIGMLPINLGYSIIEAES